MEKLPNILSATCCSVLCLTLQACASSSAVTAAIFPDRHAVPGNMSQPAATQPVSKTTASAATASNTKPVSLREAKQHFVDQEYDLAFQSLLPLAKQGDADAQYGVGYLYYYGKGTTADRDAGIDWIQKSAKQGFPNALKALQLLNVNVANTANRFSTAQSEQATEQNTPITALKTDKSNNADSAATHKQAVGNEALTAQAALLADKDSVFHESVAPAANTTLAKQETTVASAQPLYDNRLAEQPVAVTTENFTPTLDKQDIAATDLTLTSGEASSLTTGSDAGTLPQTPATANEVAILAQAIANAPEEAHTAATDHLDSYGPTKPTDTLWSIAKAVRPNNTVSVQQMMMAILKHNPQAFTTNNVNALKKNAILEIPALAEVQNYDAQSSLSELIQQQKTWHQ